MRDRKVIGGLAGLVIAGSVAALGLTLRGGFGPHFDPQPHEAGGWGMAQQAVRLLKPGGQVVVIMRDTSVFKNPATDAQFAGFKKALQAAHVPIEAIHALQVDPLRPVGVPPGDFLELIRKTPHASVIVSFMGPPVLTEAQRKRLGDSKPGIVAFCSGSMPETMDLPTLFGQGLLQAAVITRRTAPASPSLPSGLPARFERWFTVITAADLTSLPGVPPGPQGTASP